jgi:pilus assembly protein Flp/PilA
MHVKLTRIETLHNCKAKSIAFFSIHSIILLARSKKRDAIRREEVKAMLFAPKEKGQGLVEYALILVLVAIVVIVILALLGPAIGNVFSSIMHSI